MRSFLAPAVLTLLVACGQDNSSGTGTSPPLGEPAGIALPGLANTGARLQPEGTGGLRDQAWEVKCERLRADIPPCPSNGAFVPAWRVLGAPTEWVGSNAEIGFAFWIGVATNGYVPNTPGGDSRLYRYTYRASFDLTGFDPASAVIQLDWSGDNIFDGWRLNGSSFRDGSPSDGQWTSWKPLTVSAQAVQFAAAGNTLEFQLTGDGVTDGFAVRLRSLAARRR